MEKRGATRQTVMSKRQQPIFQYGTDIFFIRTVLIITESVSRQSRSVVCLVPQKEDVRMEQWRYVVKMEASFLVSVISGRNIRLVLRWQILLMITHPARHGFIRQRPKALIFVIMIREATRWHHTKDFLGLAQAQKELPWQASARFLFVHL